MVDPKSIQIVLGFYIGTVLVNIGISAYQYFSEKNPIQRWVFVYWICILVTAFANAIVEQMNILSLIGPVSGVATMGTQSVLAKVFADTFQIEFKFWKRSFPIFILGNMIGFILGSWTQAFKAYAFPMVLGAAFPVIDILWQAYRKKRHQWTSTQKLNGMTLLLMSLHYLDWPFTRNRPEYFFLGLVVAFVLLHLLSILMPMLVNEKMLADKNRNLEQIVDQRVLQITQMKESLWESSKYASLGRLAGGIAHEVSTPLSILLMTAENIKEDVQLRPEKVISSVKQIETTVGQLAKVTEALRTLAKDSSSSKVESLDLVSYSQQIFDSYQSLFQEKKIQFQFHSPQTLARLEMNPSEVQQILRSIIDNALDALSNLSERTLRIDMEVVQNFIRIHFCDSGAIPMDLREKIMDPFFTTKPFGRGMGLGLSLAKAKAEQWGGRLYLDTRKKIHALFWNYHRQQRGMLHEWPHH